MPGFVTTDTAQFDSTADHYVLNIAEDARPGDIIGRLHMDGGTPGTSTYGVDGPDSHLITIDHDGTVRLADRAELDHESAPALNVRFNALFIGNDGSMLIDQSTPSQITVTDVDEGIIFGNPSPLVTIDSATAGGTEIGRFTATDGDGDTVTYRLSGDHADKFEIDANTGIVRVRSGTTLDAADFAGHQGGLLLEVVATSRHDQDDDTGVEMTASQPVLVTYTGPVNYQGDYSWTTAIVRPIGPPREEDPAPFVDDPAASIDTVTPTPSQPPVGSIRIIDADGNVDADGALTISDPQPGQEILSLGLQGRDGWRPFLVSFFGTNGTPSDAKNHFAGINIDNPTLRLREGAEVPTITETMEFKIMAFFNNGSGPRVVERTITLDFIIPPAPPLEVGFVPSDDVYQDDLEADSYVGRATVNHGSGRVEFSLTRAEGGVSRYFQIDPRNGMVTVKQGFSSGVSTNETVRISVTDGRGTTGSNSVEHTFSINGIDVPDLPVHSIDAGASLTHRLGVSDRADGEALSYRDTDGSVSTSGGSYQVTDGQLIYTPGTGHVGLDRFNVDVIDTSGGVASASLQVTVGEPEMEITHRQTISDTSATPLDGVFGIEFVFVGSGTAATQFLIAPARNDDAVSVYRLDPVTGRLQVTDRVTDSATTPLDGAREVASVTIGGVTHVYVAALGDDAISHFTLGSDGALTPVSSLRDSGTLRLDGIKSLSQFSDETGTYLVTTASDETGASILRVGSDGRLSHLQNIGVTNSNGIGMVAEVAGDAFFVVSFPGQDEVRVFDLHSRDSSGAFTGVQTHVISDGDGTHNMLDIPLYGDSWQAGGKTFVVIPACPDHGMATYELTSSGRLVMKDSVSDPSTTNDYLFKETMVADAFQISGKNYIAVNGQYDTGFSLFSVDDNGQLDWVTSGTQVGSSSVSSWVHFATVEKQDGTTLMVTADTKGDSLSLFELGYEDFQLDPGIPVTPDI